LDILYNLFESYLTKLTRPSHFTSKKKPSHYEINKEKTNQNREINKREITKVYDEGIKQEKNPPCQAEIKVNQNSILFKPIQPNPVWNGNILVCFVNVKSQLKNAKQENVKFEVGAENNKKKTNENQTNQRNEKEIRDEKKNHVTPENINSDLSYIEIIVNHDESNKKKKIKIFYFFHLQMCGHLILILSKI